MPDPAAVLPQVRENPLPAESEDPADLRHHRRPGRREEAHVPPDSEEHRQASPGSLDSSVEGFPEGRSEVQRRVYPPGQGRGHGGDSLLRRHHRHNQRHPPVQPELQCPGPPDRHRRRLRPAGPQLPCHYAHFPRLRPGRQHQHHALLGHRGDSGASVQRQVLLQDAQQIQAQLHCRRSYLV